MDEIPLAGAAIPRVILGTSSLGSVAPDALVPAIARDRELRYLDAMLDAGCTAIDTAASYQVGGTERLLGRWMATRNNRGRLFLISKGGHPYPVVAPHRLGRDALTEDLHASLRRLRTDAIDLYLLHRDDQATPLESIVQTLVSFERAGKIKAWGVSNWRHDRIAPLAALAQSAGSRLAASSPHFSLVDWSAAPWKGSVSIAGEGHREARAFHAATQIPVLAWAALSRGFFSSHPGAGARTFESAANLARKERAERLAQKYEVSTAQIALAYLCSQPFPVAAIVATTSADRMRGNFAATRLRLLEHEVHWLESGGDSPRGMDPASSHT